LRDVAVYVMLAMEHEFEGMMIAMQHKKLLDDGEYFLIGVDSKPYDPSDPQVYIEGRRCRLFAVFVSLSFISPVSDYRVQICWTLALVL